MAGVADRIRSAWRRITLRRYKSEFSALRIARRIGPLAIFPIFLTVGFWWFALNLPAIVIGTAAISMMRSDPQTYKLFGGAIYLPLYLYAFAVLAAAAPWFFRWHFIAVALMFGRTAMADRKEAELIAAIAAAEATN
jgi:hypothetical protein